MKRLSIGQAHCVITVLGLAAYAAFLYEYYAFFLYREVLPRVLHASAYTVVAHDVLAHPVAAVFHVVVLQMEVTLLAIAPLLLVLCL